MKKKRSVIITLLAVLYAGSISAAETPFYTGRDWNAIGAQVSSAKKATAVKFFLIKAAQEASLLSGNPAVPPKDFDIITSAKYVDGIYRMESNVNIPLYFALKMAYMIQNGQPHEEIDKVRRGGLVFAMENMPR